MAAETAYASVIIENKFFLLNVDDIGRADLCAVTAKGAPITILHRLGGQQILGVTSYALRSHLHVGQEWQPKRRDLFPFDGVSYKLYLIQIRPLQPLFPGHP